MSLLRMLRKSLGDDEDEEAQEFVIFMYACAFFLFISWLTFQEIRYFFFSRSATAQVTSSSLDEEAGKRIVHFQFTDNNGNLIDHYGRVDRDFKLSDGTVEVQYFAGHSESARLKAKANYFVVLLFFVALAFLGYQIYRLAKEANEPFKVARQPTSNRRRY